MFESGIFRPSTFELSKHENRLHLKRSMLVIKGIYYRLPNNNCLLLLNVLQVFKPKFAFYRLKNQLIIINNH